MKKSGLGIASLVLGIIGLVLSCVVVGIIPCIISIIFAIIVLRKKDVEKGTAIGGLVCSIIGIIVFVICWNVIDEPSENATENTKQVEEVVQEETEQEEESGDTETFKENADNEETEKAEEIIENTIELTEIYNGNGVSIKVDSFEKSKKETTIGFVVENLSDKDYAISAHTYAVNGLMAGENLYTSDVNVPTGKKAKFSIEIDNKWLLDNGIETFVDLGVIFWGYYDNFKEWDSGVVDIKTNLYDDSKMYSVDSEEIYSDDNISVWYNGNSGNGFNFTIKNKSSYNASYTIENCSINDWSYDMTAYTYDLYSEPIHSGAYDTFTMEVDKDFMNENGISNIENVEFDILLEDAYWDYEGTLWEHSTDKIVINNQ